MLKSYIIKYKDVLSFGVFCVLVFVLDIEDLKEGLIDLLKDILILSKYSRPGTEGGRRPKSNKANISKLNRKKIGRMVFGSARKGKIKEFGKAAYLKILGREPSLVRLQEDIILKKGLRYQEWSDYIMSEVKFESLDILKETILRLKDQEVWYKEMLDKDRSGLKEEDSEEMTEELIILVDQIRRSESLLEEMENVIVSYNNRKKTEYISLKKKTEKELEGMIEKDKVKGKSVIKFLNLNYKLDKSEYHYISWNTDRCREESLYKHMVDRKSLIAKDAEALFYSLEVLNELYIPHSIRAKFRNSVMLHGTLSRYDYEIRREHKRKLIWFRDVLNNNKISNRCKMFIYDILMKVDKREFRWNIFFVNGQNFLLKVREVLNLGVTEENSYTKKIRTDLMERFKVVEKYWDLLE